jgi:hypothetical protein
VDDPSELITRVNCLRARNTAGRAAFGPATIYECRSGHLGHPRIFATLPIRISEAGKKALCRRTGPVDRPKRRPFLVNLGGRATGGRKSANRAGRPPEAAPVPGEPRRTGGCQRAGPVDRPKWRPFSVNVGGRATGGRLSAGHAGRAFGLSYGFLPMYALVLRILQLFYNQVDVDIPKNTLVDWKPGLEVLSCFKGSLLIYSIWNNCTFLFLN